MVDNVESLFSIDKSSSIDVVNIEFHKSEKRILLKIKSDTLLSSNQVEGFISKLKDMFDGCQIEVQIDFTDIDYELENDFEYAVSVFKSTVFSRIPMLKPMISKSEWEYNDEVINVRVPENACLVDLMGKDITKCLSDFYGYDFKIKYIKDSSIVLDYSAVASENNNVISIEHKKKPVNDATVLMGRNPVKYTVTKIKDIVEESGRIVIEGRLLTLESKERKNGGAIITFNVTDNTNTVPLKLFLDENDNTNIYEKLEGIKKSGDWLRIKGKIYMDTYMHELCMSPSDIVKIVVPKRMDNCEEKRVELHLHTQMSAMDALTKVDEVINTAKDWGHKAIAITDHGVVQTFPKAYSMAKKTGVKVIFGVEGYLYVDCDLMPIDSKIVPISLNFVKKGLKNPKLIEISALKDGENFHKYVNIGIPLTDVMSKECGVNCNYTDEAVSDIDAINELIEFVGDGIISSHGEDEMNYINNVLRTNGKDGIKGYFDTKRLTHYLFREIKNIELDSVAAALNISVASKGILGCNELVLELTKIIVDKMKEIECTDIPAFHLGNGEKTKKHGHGANHIIILSKDQPGLKNLYALISYSHLEYFYHVPRIPKSLLLIHRKGLMLGSACEAGELFRAILNKKPAEEIEKIALWYDYLEIQPIDNNKFLVRKGVIDDDEGLRDLNREVIKLGEKLNKPVVATCDVHFLNPEDVVFRQILLFAKGFEDTGTLTPLYLRTTDEMLDEFSYLGEEKAHEIVIDNPNMIAEMCQQCKPFLDEQKTYSPTFEGANEELSGMAISTAHKIYGDELPEIVQKRLDKELNSIIGNGYASLYLMAQKLVHKSLSDGYLVGSRGSVGSSLVATMAGITEVNPLPAHYVCPNCKHSDFDVDKSVSSCGADLPDKLCPICSTPYKKAGYEIPFEVFLGFKGDKTPDIDLNFSGDYQPVAHKFTEEMFGEGHAFRAGTISAVQDKTVFGYVSKFCEENNINMSNAEKQRLVDGCSGVKKSTGQHPGGIVIVPKEHDILEFTPVQHPADKTDSDTITTHFDFHALDDRLVKLDILGHDDPTVIRMLEDITGLDPKTIPLDDKQTMLLYSSVEPLGITLEELDCDVGTIAIPEFGTNFVRKMLMDTRPTTMEELVRIAGLSHGTDVWLGNADQLVMSGVAKLSEVICTRDDIMNFLIARGDDPSISFKIMENVRKGRGLTPEMEQNLIDNNIPEWFINSCKKIGYMFPRAHAAAYVMMGFRIAYYKLNYPLAFYSVFFTVRADDFDINYAVGGANKVLKSINAIKEKGNDAETKEGKLLPILEVVYEMNLRGIELLPIDIYKSEAVKFTIEGNAIRPPFSSIPGVGANAAIQIADACKEGMFNSIEDFIARTKANSAVVTLLREQGCLDMLPESNQITLF